MFVALDGGRALLVLLLLFHEVSARVELPVFRLLGQSARLGGSI